VADADVEFFVVGDLLLARHRVALTASSFESASEVALHYFHCHIVRKDPTITKFVLLDIMLDGHRATAHQVE